MNVVVKPSDLHGVVTAPPSKSCAHRMLIIAALANRATTLTGLPLDSAGEDAAATIAALTRLGARFTHAGDTVTVWPIDRNAPTCSSTVTLDCGESGSTLRFLLPVGAMLGIPSRFIGAGRLPERPIAPLTEQLKRHGAAFEPSERLPTTVTGSLTGGTWMLPGDVSSQFVSGLMFALPLLEQDSNIILSGPMESQGYIDLTISALIQFGARIRQTDSGYFVPGGQTYRAPDAALTVEGDWSGAAFWLGANAMGADINANVKTDVKADIQVKGLSSATYQPDSAMPELVERLISGEPVIDLSGTPDLAPILAVVASQLRAPVRLSGLGRLRLKESDRINAISAGLNELSVAATALPDALIIPDSDGFDGGVVNAQGDHRIAMAFAIAGCFSRRGVTIVGAECVAKSYARFWRDLAALGGEVGRMGSELTGE